MDLIVKRIASLLCVKSIVTIVLTGVFAYMTVTGHVTVTKAAEAKKVTLDVPVLENGITGNEVKVLQILLNGYGFPCGSADGVFGVKTLASVRNYQKSKNLSQDGVVGSKTWVSLLGI